MSSKGTAGMNAPSDDPDSSAKRKRKIRFVPLPSTPKFELSFRQGRLWSPVHGFKIRKSIWLWMAIGLLLLSNIIYAVGFLTNGWGILLVGVNKPINATNSNNLVGKIIEVNVNPPGYSAESKQESKQFSGNQNENRHQPNSTLSRNGANGGYIETKPLVLSMQEQLFTENERYWEFGLWECCRNDGFCLGTRWPAFYSATRAFAVLGLLGQILTLAWMIGHALENLLEYDPCSMGVLISLNGVTAIFVLLAVCAFGTRWPIEFRNDFHGTDTYLSYSFYLTVTSCILLFISFAFAIVELVTTWRKMKAYSRKDWATADQILGDEDEEDGIEEQAWNKITYI